MPTHDPDTIRHRMQQAEETGRTGDTRQATRLYQAIGRDTQESLGRFHPLALDAYEHMARWVAGGRIHTTEKPDND